VGGEDSKGGKERGVGRSRGGMKKRKGGGGEWGEKERGRRWG